MTTLQKATETELRRLERALVGYESVIKDTFRAFVRDMQAPAVITEVTRLLGRGELEPALRIIDAHVARFGNVVPKIFQQAGIDEAGRLAAQVAGARMVIGFDVTNRRAIELMSANRLNLIRDFTRSQRDVTRLALAEAFNTGQGPRAAALAFRDSIGLTPLQAGAVRSYRDLLRANSREALNRALRDRRFDSRVEEAVVENRPLTATQIQMMVDRYRRALVTLRAATIARTEMLRISNQARQEATRQAVEQTGISPLDVKREWAATMDHRTRDTHRDMDGQLVGLEETFVSPSGARLMFPGDPSAPPAETINCRCTVLIRVEPPIGIRG